MASLFSDAAFDHPNWNSIWICKFNEFQLNKQKIRLSALSQRAKTGARWEGLLNYILYAVMQYPDGFWRFEIRSFIQKVNKEKYF